MASSEMLFTQSSMRPTSLSTFESLPTEILDQILLLSLIPERVWVNSIHDHSAEDVSSPIAKLTCYVTDAGSQFCVETFSLNRLLISRALYAHLRSLLQKVTVFNLGKESHAQALLRRAAPSMATCGISQISLSLEHAGYKGRLSQALEDVFFLLRTHFSNVLKTLEVLIDLILFAQPAVIVEDIPDAILNTRGRVPEFFNYTSTSSHLDTRGLVEFCLLGFVTSCNTGLLNPARSEATINDLNTPGSLEVKVPCLERSPARATLLEMEFLNKYCSVNWVQTSVDKYGGPSGYISLKQRPGLPRMCCDLYIRSLIQYELYTHASKAWRRKLKIPLGVLQAWAKKECFAHGETAISYAHQQQQVEKHKYPLDLHWLVIASGLKWDPEGPMIGIFLLDALSLRLRREELQEQALLPWEMQVRTWRD